MIFVVHRLSSFTANTIAHNTINMAKQSTVTVGGVTNVVHNAILKFTGDSEPNTQANSILSAERSKTGE